MTRSTLISALLLLCSPLARQKINATNQQCRSNSFNCGLCPLTPPPLLCTALDYGDTDCIYYILLSRVVFFNCCCIVCIFITP